MLFIKVKAEATSSAGAGTGNSGKGKANRDAAKALAEMVRNPQGGRIPGIRPPRNPQGGRGGKGITRNPKGRRPKGTSEQLKFDI